jgi:hypothetical protein
MDTDGHMSLPFYSDDLNVYRVGRTGFVLTALQWTRHGKDEEHFYAMEIDELAPHCVPYLVANAQEFQSWELSIAVYGDEQVPADFIGRIRSMAADEIAAREKSAMDAKQREVEVKREHELAEYERLRVKFGDRP